MLYCCIFHCIFTICNSLTLLIKFDNILFGRCGEGQPSPSTSKLTFKSGNGRTDKLWREKERLKERITERQTKKGLDSEREREGGIRGESS